MAPRERVVLQERLEEAERHVSQSEREVARLREMIAELRRDGHESGSVLSMLRQFERSLASQIANRDRIRKELGL
jgi:phage shock protein A